jgi:hypothetical protein
MENPPVALRTGKNLSPYGDHQKKAAEQKLIDVWQIKYYAVENA